ncbi:MAG: aminoacetone oxidase family FAD-binding enzyme, partial [Spirochaetota bacterium]|nr:aminoacetone oxidase family FAD-binding enzyme [Spirochaetota bacterium]
GTKIKSDGPLLVTHWGMSGPAILKLSAFGAKLLAEKNYEFKIHVNWVHEINSELLMNEIIRIIRDHPKKQLPNYRPYLLPERLWLYLLEKQDISPKKTWGELSKKALNQLVNLLSNDIYSVKGKSPFKDEFVTCGGICLDSIDLSSLESRVCKNLYFAGEILDIDGITGGYNFQAAWSTGFVAGQLR